MSISYIIGNLRMQLQQDSFCLPISMLLASKRYAFDCCEMCRQSVKGHVFSRFINVLLFCLAIIKQIKGFVLLTLDLLTNSACQGFIVARLILRHFQPTAFYFRTSTIYNVLNFQNKRKIIGMPTHSHSISFVNHRHTANVFFNLL